MSKFRYLPLCFLLVSISAQAEWDCPYWPDMGSCVNLDPPQIWSSCRVRVQSSTRLGVSAGDELNMDWGIDHATPPELSVTLVKVNSLERWGPVTFSALLGHGAERGADEAVVREGNETVKFGIASRALTVAIAPVFGEKYPGEIKAQCE
jgi:hypothetical protein